MHDEFDPEMMLDEEPELENSPTGEDEEEEDEDDDVEEGLDEEEL
jgi:hypothetical protein